MTSANWMVQVRGISKKFSQSLRQSMSYGLRDSLSGLMGRAPQTASLRPGEFWALDNISFDLDAGQCLGIMGVNGSGKTTLLRILNNIYAPDAGEARLRGKVGALIAAGAGFSPVLTGRENIFINGALLGMTRKEIHRRLAEIIDFAEIGEFIDAPVKHYSSGMQVRLGFAIAAIATPDVLLIDEALAVGDINFQKKCYEYLHGLKRKQTAMVLVSHNIGAIWAMCDRGLFLHKGRMEAFGSVEETIRLYDDRNADLYMQTRKSSAPVQLGNENVQLPNQYGGIVQGTGDVLVLETVTRSLEDGQPRTQFELGESFVLQSVVKVLKRLEAPIFRYTIDAIHYKFIASLDSRNEKPDLAELLPGTYRLTSVLTQPSLAPGSYGLNIAVFQKGTATPLFFQTSCHRFKVSLPSKQFLVFHENAVVNLQSSFQLARLDSVQAAA